MIGALLLYGAAALLVAHVALDLRNVRQALWHGGPARDLWWTVATMVILLGHLAADLIGDIP